VKKMSLIIAIFVCHQTIAHPAHSHTDDRKFEFPDIPGYVTMVCDFHQHTVFSDGSVWPSIRVDEAIKDGLDAIALTEHLEYQPHKKDIPHPDRNRSYQVAAQAAKNRGLIVINGSEITRKMPPGHANAIFLKDATKLLLDDPIDVFKEAKRQGAFTFWNHPHWLNQTKDGTAKLTEMHRQLIRDGLLMGIEVVNDLTYSDEAIQIALDHNLTMMGTSDIHQLIDWRYNVPQGGHRPVTLVFAKKKTKQDIKDGLVNRRTAVWYNNTLIGRSEFLLPLIHASISVKSAKYPKDASVATVVLENHSDVEYILKNKGQYLFHDHADLINLDPHTTTKIEVKVLKRLPAFDLKFEVLNAVDAPQSHPAITLKVQPK